MHPLKYTRLVVDLTKLLAYEEGDRVLLRCPGCQGKQSKVRDLLKERVGDEFTELEKLHGANIGKDEEGTEFTFGQQRCYDADKLFETLASWHYLWLKFSR